MESRRIERLNKQSCDVEVIRDEDGDPLPDAARRLEESLALNAPLQCAYVLKEELGLLWEQPDGRSAWAYLRINATGARKRRPAASGNWARWPRR